MSKAKALIIDDDPNNVNVLVQLLTIEDVACATLPGSENLSANLRTLHDVDVVFLDLEMPKSDGYQALKEIKANPRFDGVPVIAYTVHVSELHSAFDLGFDGFLGKPVNAEAFPEQLEGILNGEKVWYIP